MVSYFSEAESKGLQHQSPFKLKIQRLKNWLKSENVVFYAQVWTFMALVFILPMIPMIMFILTENQPSINQRVYEELFRHVAKNSESKNTLSLQFSAVCLHVIASFYRLSYLMRSKMMNLISLSLSQIPTTVMSLTMNAKA